MPRLKARSAKKQKGTAVRFNIKSPSCVQLDQAQTLKFCIWYFGLAQVNCPNEL